MGQSGSIPQVTRNYTDPLHLRLHFTYDPTTTEIYAKPRPYTAAQVATLVRTDWPSFFNKSIAFGGGCDSPEQHYTSDDTDIDKGRTCLDIPPKRIRLTSADIREVREVTPRDATTTARRFRIDIVTKLVKNTSEPVQAYLDAHQASRNKYLVRVGTSYPLDKLVHEAFATVQQHWMGGGWLQAVNQKRSTAGRGDIYPDTTRGASSWYQYVQETQGASRNTRKGTRATATSSATTQKNRKTSHPSRKTKTGQVIRFTGFRDANLVAKLEAKGHEVTTGSMTNRVTVVVWDGTHKSQSVQKAEARPGVTLWRRERALEHA